MPLAVRGKWVDCVKKIALYFQVASVLVKKQNLFQEVLRVVIYELIMFLGTFVIANLRIFLQFAICNFRFQFEVSFLRNEKVVFVHVKG